MKPAHLLLISLLFIGVGCQAPGIEIKQNIPIPPESQIKPVVVNTATTADQQVALTVEDQDATSGVVTIKTVTTDRPRWVVIYADVGGRPSGILGQTLVDSTQTEIKVDVRTTELTDRLFATLHDETNTNQIFDFPNSDLPTLQADGKVVIVTFQANKKE